MAAADSPEGGQRGAPRDLATSPGLLAALAYARRGWAILPCHPGEKRPVTRHGVKDATRDKGAIIRTWPKRDANVAIATGTVSNIVVLDVDPRNGGDANRATPRPAQCSSHTATIMSTR